MLATRWNSTRFSVEMACPFYASPAGRRLAAAQPQLAQAQMTGVTQWMQGMMPEMQAKIAQAVKAHGWGPGGKPK